MALASIRHRSRAARDIGAAGLLRGDASASRCLTRSVSPGGTRPPSAAWRRSVPWLFPQLCSLPASGASLTSVQQEHAHKRAIPSAWALSSRLRTLVKTTAGLSCARQPLSRTHRWAASHSRRPARRSRPASAASGLQGETCCKTKM